MSSLQSIHSFRLTSFEYVFFCDIFVRRILLPTREILDFPCSGHLLQLLHQQFGEGFAMAKSLGISDGRTKRDGWHLSVGAFTYYSSYYTGCEHGDIIEWVRSARSLFEYDRIFTGCVQPRYMPCLPTVMGTGGRRT